MVTSGAALARIGAGAVGSVAVITLLLVPGAVAQTPSPVVEVEEQWELVVGTPDPDSDAPQLVCVISPVGHVQGLHAVFELNQQSLPQPSAGGLQLQLWNGEAPLGQVGAGAGALLAQTGEVVRWTQRMRLEDGRLEFEVLSGSSSTWGTFGDGQLKLSVPTGLTSLDGYSPDVTIENSGASYAANRVNALVLKRIQRRTADGQVLVDDVERVLHQAE